MVAHMNRSDESRTRCSFGRSCVKTKGYKYLVAIAIDSSEGSGSFGDAGSREYVELIPTMKAERLREKEHERTR